MTVLVTGATGFVGSHLARRLVEEGHDVRAMTRRPDEYAGPGRPVAGDVGDPASLTAALQGVEAAYYLVHSLSSTDFVREDAAAARAFGAAAAAAGVGQVVYLGGLGRDDDQLSRHLRSRRVVERLLAEAGAPVTVLRAAVVVGHGSISWELTRQLAGHLPLLFAPPWAATRTQPISVADTVSYLVGVLGRSEALDRTFEIGGADVRTNGQMLERATGARQGHGLTVVPVPIVGGVLARALTERASALALSLVTDLDPVTVRTLLGSMRNEVVVTDDAIRSLVDLDPMGYDEMVRDALVERVRAGEPL